MLQRAVTILFRAAARGFGPRGGAEPEDRRHLLTGMWRWRSSALPAKTASRRCFCGPTRSPPSRKADILRRLRGGEIIVERLRLDGSQDVPEALLHHWIGSVFIPGVRVRDTLTVMQDYDHHSSVFAPNVVRSKLLQRRGDSFKVFLRFYMKKMIAVTLNTEHDAQFTVVGPDRAYSSIHSTRIAEVEDAGRPRSTNTAEYRPWLHVAAQYVLAVLERDGGTTCSVNRSLCRATCRLALAG